MVDVWGKKKGKNIYKMNKDSDQTDLNLNFSPHASGFKFFLLKAALFVVTEKLFRISHDFLSFKNLKKGENKWSFSCIIYYVFVKIQGTCLTDMDFTSDHNVTAYKMWCIREYYLFGTQEVKNLIMCFSC